MNKIFAILPVLLFGLTDFSFSQSWQAKTERAEYIHRAIKQVTDVMVYDIYSPPVTSRTYAYVSVAGYETLIQNNDHYLSFAGQLHGLTQVPAPDKHEEYSPTLAAVHAILTTGKPLVISEEKIGAYEKELFKEFMVAGMPARVFNNSLTYGKQVADHIIAWAREDQYKETRSLPQYRVRNDAASWKPTPPVYIKAIEPNWNRLRPFAIDSATQFKPVPPPAFSTDTNSLFYKDAYEVYSQVKRNTAEQIEVAKFWDCNPFTMNVRGHVMYATKKISPNGHWMNITRLACQKVNADIHQSAEAYAYLALTLADCFISCWEEKYRSIVIRPETYINQHIDPAWLPVLQTPPFPEYTSGHSVISAGASIALTQLFGKNFSFADSSEVEFGLPVRYFSSFIEAANEAAISRLYGGIHYMPAIKNGQEQGFAVGRYLVGKLRMRRENQRK